MEMFDTHRRDILNFDNYMDLKKPGFGGPQSAIALRDARGSKIDKSPKLDGYRRTVERDPAFSHPVYDPTYKAMTNDLVYKQEKKKPFTYDDTRTGIPVVEIEPLKEGKAFLLFQRFINENEKEWWHLDSWDKEEAKEEPEEVQKNKEYDEDISILDKKVISERDEFRQYLKPIPNGEIRIFIVNKELDLFIFLYEKRFYKKTTAKEYSVMVWDPKKGEMVDYGYSDLFPDRLSTHPGNYDGTILELMKSVTRKGEKRSAPSLEKPIYVYSLPTTFEASPEFANKFVKTISSTNENTIHAYLSFQEFISEEIDYSLEAEMREDNPEELDQIEDNPEELDQIEAKLRGFEGDFDTQEDDVDFGANPMDYEEGDEEYRDYGMYPEDDTELEDPYFSKGDDEYPYETEGDEEYRDYGMYPEDDTELEDAES